MIFDIEAPLKASDLFYPTPTLESLRQVKKLALEQVAEIAGISLAQIEQIEKGLIWPSTGEIENLTKALDATEEEVVAALEHQKAINAGIPEYSSIFKFIASINKPFCEWKIFPTERQIIDLYTAPREAWTKEDLKVARFGCLIRELRAIKVHMPYVQEAAYYLARTKTDSMQESLIHLLTTRGRMVYFQMVNIPDDEIIRPVLKRNGFMDREADVFISLIVSTEQPQKQDTSVNLNAFENAFIRYLVLVGVLGQAPMKEYLSASVFDSDKAIYEAIDKKQPGITLSNAAEFMSAITGLKKYHCLDWVKRDCLRSEKGSFDDRIKDYSGLCNYYTSPETGDISAYEKHTRLDYWASFGLKWIAELYEK